MRCRVLLAWCAAAIVWPALASAQDESAIAAEFRREREALAHSCGHFSLGAIPSCAFTLVTANPLHVSFGSLSPQSGIGFGAAFVGHHTPNETWRVGWSTDAVRAPGGAWRAGGYVNFVRTDVVAPVPSFDESDASEPTEEMYPVYSLYAQTTSLTDLSFFRPGEDSPQSSRATWAMEQTILGGSLVVPLRGSGRLGLAMTGSINGRILNIRDGRQSTVPRISSLYSAADVPGVGDQKKYLQLSGGLRLTPTAWTHLRPSYRFNLDQFVGDASRRFARWTIDVTHEFPFYRTLRPVPRDGNTPNDCSVSISNHACPSPSRNRYGTLSFRILAIGSAATETGNVPFYFQPTLGGADIDNSKFLLGFENYRFRGKNLLGMQLAAEHTLIAIPLPRGYSLPLGGLVMVEQGRSAEDWTTAGWRRSYAAGLTIRAGGFPEVFLVFAWDDDGHRRFNGSINPSLLGGAPRPPLQ